MHARLAALALLAPAALAQHAYRTVPLDELTWTAGAPDLRRELLPLELRGWPQPEARSDARETWLGLPYRQAWGEETTRLGALELSVRGRPGAWVSGELWLRMGDGSTARHPFALRLGEAGEAGRADFLESRYLAYAWRHALDLPGAAWFRHRKRATAEELASLGRELPRFEVDDALRGFRGRRNGPDETYDLFTGGRALAENLALDDALVVDGGEGYPAVPLVDIEGVEVPGIDWAPLLEGLEPELDPLAARIPADQHAVFFGTFAALTRVLDELRLRGAPVLELLDASSQDAATQVRYERQLALPLDAAARLLGGQLVSGVAITGGDPYFRTGTDVAVLFSGPSPRVLVTAIAARQEQAAAGLEGVETVDGVLRGVGYQGVRTPDRGLCSYVAQLGGDVVVTNSLAQLAALVAVGEGARPALADAPEYRWFRDRYRRGQEEDALVVITDATIRRWASPRWRIGASRRTRAAAWMSDQVAAGVAASLLDDRRPARGGGRSDVYGDPDFLTPIGELEIEHVMPAEAEAYGRFRRRYANLWREVFDPAAARLVVRPDRLELDLSVRPLIVRSDYRDLVELTRGATLAPRAGDPHPGTALHFAMALGRESRLYRDFAGFLGETVFSRAADPLAWLGDDVSVWLEDDPEFWRAAAGLDPSEFLEQHLWRMPIAARLPSNNPLRLAAFLTGLRSFIEGAAPGLVRYETREHAGRAYAALLPADLQDLIDQPLALYYVSLPDAWVLSLREDVIHAVIDRFLARQPPDAEPWIGQSASLRLGPGFRPMLAALYGEDWRNERQRLAWRALPILDEWRRLAPDRDPVEFHREHFGVTLRGPDGGAYVFDEGWGRMACDVYGHPGRPGLGPLLPRAVEALEGAQLGVTFEEGNGLRARVRLDR